MKRNRIFTVLVLLLCAACLLQFPAAAAPDVPVLTQVPQNYCWPEGFIATYYCRAAGDEWCEIYRYEWYLTVDGITYALNGTDETWRDYAPGVNTGVYNGGTVTLEALQPGINGAEIYCIVYSDEAWVETPHALITLGAPEMFYAPEITAPVELRCKTGETVALDVTASGRSGNVSETTDGLSYQWYRTDTGRLQDIRAIVEQTQPTLTTSFDEPGTYYFVCGVFDGEDTAYANYSYSNVITVFVEQGAQTPIQTEPTETEAPTEPTETEPAATAPVTTEPAQTETRPTDVAPIPSEQEAGASSGNLPAIIGCILAGLLGLGLIAAAFVWKKRK